MEFRVELIGAGIEVCVSDRHTFGTDSLLLSDFSKPRRNDISCDLCSGCGIVPLLWFRDENHPKKAWCMDIQEEATALLSMSVERCGLSDKIAVLQSDLRKCRAQLAASSFSLITCNPPYFRVGSGFASSQASDLIARHETLCTLDDVCAAAEWLLKYGGRFCICHLPERLCDVLCVMREHCIEPKRLRFVQQTVQSAPWLVLVEGKRGAKPAIVIEPPLIMKDQAGDATMEMQRIHKLYGKI